MSSEFTGLHPTMEKFYLSIVDYAGMKFDNGIIINKQSSLGDITIDDKHITLPYFEILKNPNNRSVLHLLNENYTNPESTMFNLYKKRLVLELNIKLSITIISLIGLAADPLKQQRIKNSSLIELISNLGEVDHSVTEAFVKMVDASKKANGENFIFSIFLKKNGKILDTPYAATGKLNLLLFTEANRALEEGKDYKVFGYKARKKDLLFIQNLFNVIFPDIDKTGVQGTDNKCFRYLNALLKTAFTISSRLNEINSLLDELKDESLLAEENMSNHDWVECLEPLYELTREIRLIPSQVDAVQESRHTLSINEEASKQVPPWEDAPKQPPVFDPNKGVQPQTPEEVIRNNPNSMVQQPVQPTQPLTPEEIIRSRINPNIGMNPMPPMGMYPNMQMPMYNNPQMGNSVPSWVMQEAMMNNQRPMPNIVQPMQQMNPQMVDPRMMQYNPAMGNMMNPNMAMNQQQMMQMQQMCQPTQPQMQQPMQQGGLQLNPLFFR